MNGEKLIIGTYFKIVFGSRLIISTLIRSLTQMIGFTVGSEALILLSMHISELIEFSYTILAVVVLVLILLHSDWHSEYWHTLYWQSYWHTNQDHLLEHSITTFNIGIQGVMFIQPF